MIWPWPENDKAFDPVDWVMPFKRFNEERWKTNWNEWFATYDLIHNNRAIVKILLSDQNDAALAVVDIDTLWRDKNGNEDHWFGRVSKGFSKVDTQWKLIMHTGVLRYD